jgi:hypothetical protein
VKASGVSRGFQERFIDGPSVFEQFGQRLPVEMWAQHEALRRRLDVLG